MIFQHTWSKIVAGEKTETSRRHHQGDKIERDAAGKIVCVRNAAGVIRWRVGQHRAVQPERCHRSLATILITKISEPCDRTALDAAALKAEGFSSQDEFLRIWNEMHGRNAHEPAFVIQFRLLGIHCDLVRAMETVAAASGSIVRGQEAEKEGHAVHA